MEKYRNQKSAIFKPWIDISSREVYSKKNKTVNDLLHNEEFRLKIIFYFMGSIENFCDNLELSDKEFLEIAWDVLEMLGLSEKECHHIFINWDIGLGYVFSFKESMGEGSYNFHQHQREPKKTIKGLWLHLHNISSIKNEDLSEEALHEFLTNSEGRFDRFSAPVEIPLKSQKKEDEL